MCVRRSALAVIISFFVFAGTGLSQPLDRNTFININKKLQPSVISIYVKIKKNAEDTKANQEGVGSGFLIDDARILTNYHVIEDAVDITIAFNDGRKITALLLGGDSKIDLAVLKLQGDIDKNSLLPATLGDSSLLEVGAIVVAMGNPQNLGTSMTWGIVSAVGRSRETLLADINFIQTDAAINQGNSGGPLINIDGEVVGINTAIMAGYGVSGIGFAIPINYAKDIIQRLSEGKKIGAGWIGAAVTKPHADDYSLWKLPAHTAGVIVTKITPGSPAQQAGLLRNDFITMVDQRAVLTQKDFEWFIRNAVQPVLLTVWRMGIKISIAVPVIQEPQAQPPPVTPPQRHP